MKNLKHTETKKPRKPKQQMNEIIEETTKTIEEMAKTTKTIEDIIPIELNGENIFEHILVSYRAFNKPIPMYRVMHISKKFHDALGYLTNIAKHSEIKYSDEKLYNALRENVKHIFVRIYEKLQTNIKIIKEDIKIYAPQNEEGINTILGYIITTKENINTSFRKMMKNKIDIEQQLYKYQSMHMNSDLIIPKKFNLVFVNLLYFTNDFRVLVPNNEFMSLLHNIDELTNQLNDAKSNWLNNMYPENRENKEIFLNNKQQPYPPNRENKEILKSNQAELYPKNREEKEIKRYIQNEYHKAHIQSQGISNKNKEKIIKSQPNSEQSKKSSKVPSPQIAKSNTNNFKLHTAETSVAHFLLYMDNSIQLLIRINSAINTFLNSISGQPLRYRNPYNLMIHNTMNSYRIFLNENKRNINLISISILLGTFIKTGIYRNSIATKQFMIFHIIPSCVKILYDSLPYFYEISIGLFVTVSLSKKNTAKASIILLGIDTLMRYLKQNDEEATIFHCNTFYNDNCDDKILATSFLFLMGTIIFAYSSTFYILREIEDKASRSILQLPILATITSFIFSWIMAKRDLIIYAYNSIYGDDNDIISLPTNKKDKNINTNLSGNDLIDIAYYSSEILHALFIDSHLITNYPFHIHLTLGKAHYNLVKKHSCNNHVKNFLDGFISEDLMISRITNNKWSSLSNMKMYLHELIRYSIKNPKKFITEDRILKLLYIVPFYIAINSFLEISIEKMRDDLLLAIEITRVTLDEICFENHTFLENCEKLTVELYNYINLYGHYCGSLINKKISVDEFIKKNLSFNINLDVNQNVVLDVKNIANFIHNNPNKNAKEAEMIFHYNDKSSNRYDLVQEITVFSHILFGRYGKDSIYTEHKIEQICKSTFETMVVGNFNFISVIAESGNVNVILSLLDCLSRIEMSENFTVCPVVEISNIIQ